MTEVNIHQAKTQLSQLLRLVAAGEEVIIARSGKPIARLVPIEPHPTRIFGSDVGLFAVPDDFDDALPVDVLDEFEK